MSSPSQSRLGREFDVDDVRLMDAQVRAKRAIIHDRTRVSVAVYVMGVSTAVIAFGGWLAVATEMMDPLKEAWALVSAPMGVMLGFYFRGRMDRRDE